MLPLIHSFEGGGRIEAAFRAWAGKAHTARLQGGWDRGGMGRYTIVAVDPYCVLSARGDAVCRTTRDGEEAWRGDPFTALEREYRRLRGWEGSPGGTFLPFLGGGIGYLGYGLRHFVERVPARASLDLPTPDLYFAFYDVALVYDHRDNRGYLVSTGLPEEGEAARHRAAARLDEARAWLDERPAGVGRASLSAKNRKGGHAGRHPERAPEAAGSGASVLREENCAMDRQTYMAAVERAKAYIAAGDVYQVNLSQRFSVPAPFEATLLFDVLREVNPSPFGAYLRGPDWTVVSVSPERFFLYDGAVVETRPIKGTRPRGKSPEEDDALRRELLASAKDRAEHVMIVDLERNDLGRFCAYHTVHVPELMVTEAHPTVWHLVSTVRGVPRTGVSPVEAVRSAFPGGSITGAPKVRAMEIIDELEPVARGVYTGSIGYLSAGGRIDLNIAIRTVVLAGGMAHFHVGGGIVADSDPEAEYQETLDKGLGIARAIEIARRLAAGGGEERR